MLPITAEQPCDILEYEYTCLPGSPHVRLSNLPLTLEPGKDVASSMVNLQQNVKKTALRLGASRTYLSLSFALDLHLNKKSEARAAATYHIRPDAALRAKDQALLVFHRTLHQQNQMLLVAHMM